MATEVDPLAFQKGFAATQGIFDNARQNRLAEMAFGQKQQEVAQQNALAGVVGNLANYDETGAFKREALPLVAQASPTALPQYQKLIQEQTTNQAAQQKAQREAQKAQLEQHMQTVELASRTLSGVRDQAGLDAARAYLATVSPEGAASLPATYDKASLDAIIARGMSLKDQTAQRLQQMQFEETRRHNRATEGNTAGQLSVAQQRLAFDQNAPRGQIVQTDQGPMLVDPRTGTSRPVTDASGQQVQKPGKEIPASVNKSIIENQQNIGKIDAAIAAIQKSPGALGTVNMLPGVETIRQYTGSPEDIEARAGVADVGSLILHDRSGASVTASETPRLKPFIPAASDRPDVAIKKLQRFKELYQQEANLLAETYSKEQGYRASPSLNRNQAANTQAPAAKAQDQAATIKELQRRAQSDPALAAKLKAMGY